MKYIFLFFSTLFFLFGILASRGLQAYIHPETNEYHEDVLLLASYTSGQAGARSFCYNHGLLKSTMKKKSIHCDLVNKCCPDIHIKKWGKDVSVGPYSKINVLVNQTGKVHIRDRTTGEILPVKSTLSFWSLPTFLMGQFIVLIVFLSLKKGGRFENN